MVTAVSSVLAGLLLLWLSACSALFYAAGCQYGWGWACFLTLLLLLLTVVVVDG